MTPWALSAGDERCARIHAASLALLETTGFQVAFPAILSRCKAHGLRVEENRIFFSQKAVESALATVPRRFRLLARNPENNLGFDPQSSHVGLGRSAAFILGPDGERRQATGEDLVELVKLGQMLDEIRLVGNLVTPAEIPAERVNAFMLAAQLRYSDKPCHLLHPSDLPLLCAAFGIERRELAAACERGEAYAHTTVNTISPLALGTEPAELLLAMAESGIPVHISPAPAMGSSSPCTIAGTLVVNNTEILAVLTLAQLIRPGLPVTYGVLPSGSDMRSLAATFGAPEARLLEAGAAGMALRYGLLTRGNVALNDTFGCDFQAGAEAMLNFIGALSQRISYLPGCGLLASFAGASRAKLLLDAELAAYARRLARPWSAGEEDLAVDLIARVGPRGSFLGQPHTVTHCRSALYHPPLFCRSSYERWREGESLVRRAEERAERLLEQYTAPPLAPAAERLLARALAP